MSSSLLRFGHYRIVNRGTGTALDGAGRTTAGPSAVMWAPNRNTDNRWTLTAV